MVVFLLLLIIFVFNLCINKKETSFNIECSLQPTQDIVPVLYYEENIGGLDYNTHTFLIEEEKAVYLEKHYRTFSKTYPSSAYERFKDIDSVWNEYGQLMAFYNINGNKIFLFNGISSQKKINKYTLIKNDVETDIYYEINETYYDFLFFDKNYYLFTLAKSHPELLSKDILRVYKISENLSVEESFDINYGSQGIPTYVFIENTVAIADNTLYVTVQKNGESYLLKYDFKNNLTTLLPMEYHLLGVISDTERFVTVGFNDKNEIVFETLTAHGKSINKKAITLPLVFELSDEDIYFDDVFYMYGSDIYCCFYLGNKCCFVSYNVDQYKWTNWWVVESTTEAFLPMDVKYMVRVDDSYYDLFPYCNNGN